MIIDKIGHFFPVNKTCLGENDVQQEKNMFPGELERYFLQHIQITGGIDCSHEGPHAGTRHAGNRNARLFKRAYNPDMGPSAGGAASQCQANFFGELDRLTGKTGRDMVLFFCHFCLLITPVHAVVLMETALIIAQPDRLSI